MSACLIGLDTKYSGGSNANDLLIKYFRMGVLVPVCPEQLGGLPTPRAPSEIVGGSGEDVISRRALVEDLNGEDRTREYIKGASETLKIIKLLGSGAAILKDGSPSCGSSRIYDGTFKGIEREGQGVACALLRKNGIQVLSERNLTEDYLLGLAESPGSGTDCPLDIGFRNR